MHTRIRQWIHLFRTPLASQQLISTASLPRLKGRRGSISESGQVLNAQNYGSSRRDIVALISRYNLSCSHSFEWNGMEYEGCGLVSVTHVCYRDGELAKNTRTLLPKIEVLSQSRQRNDNWINKTSPRALVNALHLCGLYAERKSREHSAYTAQRGITKHARATINELFRLVSETTFR